ncbi:MAG: hypothetical protein JXL80_10440 [Planctomycetes bacterium]|nr:hypothetical protein [Planctomycetota bacterium]
MAKTIRIKPHHLVDIITDVGRGQTAWQPHPFGHAVHTVAAAIVADLDVEIEMDFGADDICAPCSHNIGGLCDDVIDTSYRPAAPKSKREWNLLIDRRWSERLGLVEGRRLTTREFCRLLRDLAGDIIDIYREVPAERTAERAARLRKGIDACLGDPS